MEHNDSLQLRAPRQRERFGWFALSHFVISFIGVAGALLSTALDGSMLAVLFVWEFVLLALYWAAGTWSARRKRWARPQSVREGLWAFFSPTLVAWIWGGLFLMFLSVPGLMTGMGDTGDIIAVVLMYSLLFLAFPSSAGFIMLTLFTGGLDADFTAQWPLFFVYLFVVGAVPPALFLLGSTVGVRKGQRQVPQE